MTYLEAAHKILSKSGQPLHYQEITTVALEQGLISPSGKTPEATMGSRLYTDTKQDGSEFVRAGRGMFALAKRQPVGIEAQVRAINVATRKQVKELLHTMPPDRFEELIRELLIQMDFDESTLRVTSYSNDGGIDVVGVLRAAGLTDVNAAVQAKRWKGNVAAPTVTQLRGSLQVHQQGIIITSSDFSKGARQEAHAPGKTRISLINGDKLLDLLFKHKVGVQERTLTVMSVDEEWWGALISHGDVLDEPDKADKPDQLGGDIGETVVAPTGHRPSGFILLGQSHSADSWKSVLVMVSSLLARQHPYTFEEKALTLKGRKRRYYAADPAGMTRAEHVPGTNLWVEVNLSAKDIHARVNQLMALFNYQADELTILY